MMIIFIFLVFLIFTSIFGKVGAIFVVFESKSTFKEVVVFVSSFRVGKWDKDLGFLFLD